MLRIISLFFSVFLLTSCSHKTIKNSNDFTLKTRYYAHNHGKAPQFLDTIISQNANELDFFPYKIKLDEKEFITNLFNAWSYEFPINKAEILWFLNYNKQGFDINGNEINKQWLTNLKQNANQNSYNTINKKAITTDIVNARIFPTKKPFFLDKLSASQNNFDDFQISVLGAFSPVLISHFSKDKNFAFVKTDAFFGWIESKKLLILDEFEAQKFMDNNFAVFIKDNQKITNAHFKSRLGGIFPYTKQDSKNFIFNGKIANKNFNFSVSKKIASNFLQVNDKNLKNTANTLISQKYGWGGMHKLRDCSLFIKDFFAVFGLHLPRNSQAQGRVANKIQIKNLNNTDKEKMLANFGLPFTTLLVMSGHVMLWVGNSEVLHNSWGIRTADDNRSIIGKTAITDLQIAKGYEDINNNALLLSKLNSFNIIIDPKKIALENAYNVKIDKNIKFDDGFILPYAKNKTLKDIIYNKNSPSQNASVEDMLSLTYPLYKPLNAPLIDAGRIRNKEFFNHIYGASQDEVRQNLVYIIWLKSSLNEKILFNAKNGAAAALQRVSDKLDELSKENPKILEFLRQSGTFKYRKIANSKDLSPHSWGIAIDIGVKYSSYWQWQKEYKNYLPFEVVQAFEQNGFIWGGRWKHFDTMHFEYRPEFMMLEKLKAENF